jgi:hypothetical protein
MQSAAFRNVYRQPSLAPRGRVILPSSEAYTPRGKTLAKLKELRVFSLTWIIRYPVMGKAFDVSARLTWP